MPRFLDAIGLVKYGNGDLAQRLRKKHGLITCELKGCTAYGLPETQVDHCHKHGWVRGVLCRKHNISLGHIEAVMAEAGVKVDLSKTFYADYLYNCPDCCPFSEKTESTYTSYRACRRGHHLRYIKTNQCAVCTRRHMSTYVPKPPWEK